MTNLIRVTITLPGDLLEAAEARLGSDHGSRSGLIRRIIEDALRAADEREKVQQYVRGYREEPQTEEEFGWSDWALTEGLKELPWDASR